MSINPDHTTRQEYSDLVEALRDADRVLSDLQALATEQLVVPANDLQFLTRRARTLVRACIDREVNRA